MYRCQGCSGARRGARRSGRSSILQGRGAGSGAGGALGGWRGAPVGCACKRDCETAAEPLGLRLLRAIRDSPEHSQRGGATAASCCGGTTCRASLAGCHLPFTPAGMPSRALDMQSRSPGSRLPHQEPPPCSYWRLHYRDTPQLLIYRTAEAATGSLQDAYAGQAAAAPSCCMHVCAASASAHQPPAPAARAMCAPPRWLHSSLQTRAPPVRPRLHRRRQGRMGERGPGSLSTQLPSALQAGRSPPPETPPLGATAAEWSLPLPAGGARLVD